jgi:hypothetical protein
MHRSFLKNSASILWKEVCSIKKRVWYRSPKIEDTLIWSFVNTWHWSHKARGLFNKKLILKVWNLDIFFFVMKPRITWFKCYVISTHTFFLQRYLNCKVKIIFWWFRQPTNMCLFVCLQNDWHIKGYHARIRLCFLLCLICYEVSSYMRCIHSKHP